MRGFQKLWFAPPRKSAQRAPLHASGGRRTLAMERLESRNLLAGEPATWDGTTGSLTVTGTDSRDEIVFYLAADMVVPGRFYVNVSRTSW